MPPIDYAFDERLAMSQGVSATKDVRDILLANIPGAVNVIAAHATNDRNGVDYWVEMVYGGFVSVDTKIREEDWAAKPVPKDDLALETFSVVENNVIGWTRDAKKRTDYVLWFWKDTGRWCLVPFRFLCQVFQQNWQEWSRKFGTKRQHTDWDGGGYHSECVFVPRKVVWAEIYKRYSGLTKKQSAPSIEPQLDLPRDMV